MESKVKQFKKLELLKPIQLEQTPPENAITPNLAPPCVHINTTICVLHCIKDMKSLGLLLPLPFQPRAHSSWLFSSSCPLFFNSELLHFIFPLSLLSILVSPRQPCTPRDSFQKLEISPEKVCRTCVWEVEPVIVLFSF